MKLLSNCWYRVASERGSPLVALNLILSSKGLEAVLLLVRLALERISEVYLACER